MRYDTVELSVMIKGMGFELRTDPATGEHAMETVDGYVRGPYRFKYKMPKNGDDVKPGDIVMASLTTGKLSEAKVEAVVKNKDDFFGATRYALGVNK